MKRVYSPNYKGYIILPRGILSVLSINLSVIELAYFIIFLTQADYDSRHKETYAIILRDDKQIAEINKVNLSTITKNKNKLIKRGYIYKNTYGNYYIPLLPLFIKENAHMVAGLNFAQAKELFAPSHLNPADLKDKIAKMHMDNVEFSIGTSQKKSKSTFSSKEALSSSNEEKGKQIKEDDIPF